MKNTSIAIQFLFLTSVSITQVFAESSATPTLTPEKPEVQMPKTGRLAGTVSGGLGGFGTSGPWVGKDPEGSDVAKAPLSASINRSGEKWILRLSNKSEDQYTASVRVSQSDSNAKTVKTNSYNITLPAGGSTERSLVAHFRAASAVADLTRWTVKKKKKTTEETQPEVQGEPVINDPTGAAVVESSE